MTITRTIRAVKSRIVLLLVAALAATVPLAPPSAAKQTQVVKGTIAISTAELSSLFGSGWTNVDTIEQARRTCPGPGEFDGSLYKFWDLKGEWKTAKLSGPKPVFGQDLPGGIINHQNDYDLDLYALDSRCKLIDGFSSNTAGATEKGSARKSFRYVVAVYWAGPYPNIPVQVEVTR